jgi:HEAT repeat protein
MVVVLEKLVAKGRRVHHARDQREVAFGLAALSTKKEIHFNILKKGGVKTLTHLLKSSSDVEAQRFASLALANTACIENYKSDFVREDECLDGILSELRNDDADLVVRRYCAMALGNLASDPETHIEISDRGGLFAVTHFLKVVAKEKELEAGRCVTLAISNLAINPSHRRRFIQYGAIENLIYISCWDDWAVKCKALVALRAICLSYELRIVVLNAGVIDPLVIISRSDNVSVLREVAAMFNCLSAVTEKKNEISDRALSTITALLFAHDSVIEFHASCTIANLTEEHATHHRFLTESGPSHILALNQNCRVDSKGEVMRTLSNLSKNKESRSHLLSTDVFKAAVEALDTSDVNCQKFAAALLANLTADDVSHALIIREGVLCPLIHMICEGSASMEAQRYAALTLANISSTRESHDVIYKAQGIEALLKLSKSADTFSQKNVACTYANFARYADIHSYILKKGIIQSITFLMQNRDSDIRLYLSAALRGMSTNTNTSIKIVQEGGLEILLPLLSSNDILILRNVTACLYNLSIMTENKLEISQLGCIPLLIRLIEHDDSDVSCNCCACLSNISEMSCYRGSIASEGGIKASMMAMHSKFLELQRKSGRLFSLLCGCNISRILDEIIQNEGHRFLISYLTSHDSYVIHSGLIGILNLSAHKEHRVDITKARVLAPLLNIITEDLDSDLQKMAMMSIVNLSDDTDNHLTFMKEGILDAMISLYNSPVCEMKAYAALVVANIAKNVSMGQRISCCRGGVESILDLARMDHSPFRKTILGAIASLSFIKKNREQICFRGGIKQLLEDFRTESKDSSSFNFMCCAVANLSENAEHNAFLAEIGVVPLLTNILTSYEFEDINEAIRALGNLAIDPQLCLDISQNDHVICKVLRFISKGNEFAVRMAYMMMTNVAANIKTHDYLLRVDIMSPIVKYLKNALNPKLKDSDETISYALLLVANLWANKDTHNMIAENVIGKVIVCMI